MQNDILYKLGSIEGKQDIILLNQSELSETMKEHSKRLDKVEKNQFRSAGFAAGVAGVFGYFVNMLFKGA